MRKLSRDELTQMVVNGIEIKKLTANQTDNIMKEYLERQGLASISPSRPMTSVDDEAIREFQLNQKLDAQGEPIVLERIPIELPQEPQFIEEPNQNLLQSKIRTNQILLRSIYSNYDSMNIEIEEMRKQIDQMDSIAQKKEIDDITKQVERNLKFVDHLLGKAQDLEAQNRTIQEQIEEIPRIRQVNEGLKAEWERTVNQIMDEYDRTNILRVASTERQPLESEEDYQMRLVAIQQSRDEILQEAFQFKYDQFKKDLKEIIRNPAIIELVLNSLTKEELIEYHKIWPKLKADFVSIYGVNSNRVSADDVLESFNSTIRKMEYENLKPSYEREKRVSQIMTKPNLNDTTRSSLFLSPIKRGEETQVEMSPWEFGQRSTQEDEYTLMESRTPPNQSSILGDRRFERIEPKSKSIIQSINNKYDNPSVEYVRKLITEHPQSIIHNIALFNSSGRKKSKAELLKEVERVVEREQDTMLDREGDGKVSFVGFGLPGVSPLGQTPPNGRFDSNSITGARGALSPGLGRTSNEQGHLGKKAHLGKVILDLHKLYYNNQLSVRDKNNYVIGGFKVSKVSDDFVNIVMSLVNGMKVSKEDLKQLQITERQLYDNLIFLAGLHKGNFNSSDKTIKYLKEREKVLIGEVMAGNDNPEIYAQYKSILHKLNHFGEISQNMVKERLREIRGISMGR